MSLLAFMLQQPRNANAAESRQRTLLPLAHVLAHFTRNVQPLLPPTAMQESEWAQYLASVRQQIVCNPKKVISSNFLKCY